MNEPTLTQASLVYLAVLGIAFLVGLIIWALVKTYQRSKPPAPEPKHQHQWQVYGTGMGVTYQLPSGQYMVHGFKPHARECTCYYCNETQVAVYVRGEIDHWRKVGDLALVGTPANARVALQQATQRARKEQAHAL